MFLCWTYVCKRARSVLALRFSRLSTRGLMRSASALAMPVVRQWSRLEASSSRCAQLISHSLRVVLTLFRTIKQCFRNAVIVHSNHMTSPPKSCFIHHGLQAVDVTALEDFIVCYFVKPFNPCNPPQGSLGKLLQASGLLSCNNHTGMKLKLLPCIPKCWYSIEYHYLSIGALIAYQMPQ